MDHKPFDRFSDKPRRSRDGRFGERNDRFSAPRGDRFADRGDRFADRGDRFADRGDRFADRGDRFADRGERKERFGDRPFGEKRFGDKPGFKKFGQRRDGDRMDFGTRSGPRAKAVQTRRFTDRAAFVQTATVRLDADVAKYFKTAESVNEALRQLIALAALVKPEEKKAEPVEQVEEQEDVAVETNFDEDEGLEMAEEIVDAVSEEKAE